MRAVTYDPAWGRRYWEAPHADGKAGRSDGRRLTRRMGRERKEEVNTKKEASHGDGEI